MSSTGDVVVLNSRQRLILRQRIEEHMYEGLKLLHGEEIDRGAESGWASTALGLVEQALGKGHLYYAVVNCAQAGLADIMSAHARLMNADATERTDRRRRIECRVPVLRQVLDRIDLEAELDAAADDTGEVLPREDFGFIASKDLRAIAQRDYLELRTCLGLKGTVVARLILAGAVIEAVLFDALGEPAALRDVPLGELIKAARRVPGFSDKITRHAESASKIRNLAHPGRELIEEGIAPGETTIALELMKLVIAEARKRDNP